ncbi:MAG: multicopper oxidase family protein [Actinomycetota bacterium]|nr:multicopper oxidase family protein [Actinomycetota bacterium]
MEHRMHAISQDTEFPTDVVGLEPAGRPELVDVAPGSTFDLHIVPVAKQINGAIVRMLAYNGSIPGPTLRVRQGSEIYVDVSNDGDIDTTVHWHGLRLDNRYDGVPHDTQDPITPGGKSYKHRLRFPDAGLFWYHPHLREDFAQEMGLYANVIVVPNDAGYWPPVDREVAYTLDDILLEDGKIVPFSPHGPDHVAMGRFGNVLLVGGEPQQHLDVARGEVIRFFLTNTANTRVFKVQLPGAVIKLVGGDGGRYECEQFVDEVVLAPSERAIVDVRFDSVGFYTLQHVTPRQTYPMVTIAVNESSQETAAGDRFTSLRVNGEMRTQREALGRFLDATPDKILAFVAEMDSEEPAGGPATYSCPMHPEVTSDQPGKCPQCGMKLMPAPAPSTYSCPMHPEVTSDQPGKCPQCGMKLVPSEQVAAATSTSEPRHAHQGHHGDPDVSEGRIEWEDLMPELNRRTTAETFHWKLIDHDSGKVNGDIDWTFNVGDQVKIRLVNEMESSDHPMHHPFHIHGERFLVLARDGVKEPNLVWKDTVLVRTGETVDILMDASNPGRWMAHCHIAEHAESGMMFTFDVKGS